MAGIQYTFKRYEKKYMLTPEQYRKLLSDIGKEIEEDEYGQYTICNIYYDTPNYELIRTSIEKPVYKEKFRLRSYGVPKSDDTIFAEIKKKYNGVVYKRRIAEHPDVIRAFIEEKQMLQEDRQIQGEIQWFLQMYDPVPKVFIGYDRTAFAGKEDKNLRITFDRNIRWRDKDLDLQAGDAGEPVLSEDGIVMEIKVPNSFPMWLVSALSRHEIYPVSFSKYGTCYKRYIAANLF